MVIINVLRYLWLKSHSTKTQSRQVPGSTKSVEIIAYCLTSGNLKTSIGINPLYILPRDSISQHPDAEEHQNFSKQYLNHKYTRE
jgi:hypothetical protein